MTEPKILKIGVKTLLIASKKAFSKIVPLSWLKKGTKKNRLKIYFIVIFYKNYL